MDVCNGMFLEIDYYHDDRQPFIGTRRKNLLKKSVTLVKSLIFLIFKFIEF